MKKWLQSGLLGALMLSTQVYAAGSLEEGDPIAPVLLGVLCIFFLALLGRYFAKRWNLPVVLAELTIGVLAGNLLYWCGLDLVVLLREGASIFEISKHLLEGAPLAKAVSSVIPAADYANQVVSALSGTNGAQYFKIAYVMDIFSRFGVLFLLFMVGLESSVEELKHNGRDATLVALIGIAAPMLLGFCVAALLLPDSSFNSDLFIAATLSATSIGITARVLKELKQLNSKEAKTILGAAMLDDVLGLMLLAVVSSLVISGSVDVLMVLRIIASAVLFFVGIVTLGPYVLRASIRFFSFLEPWEAKLFIPFLFMLALSWLASSVQLAAIIGAFSAGVLIHDDYFKCFDPTLSEKRTIQQLMAPLESIFAPLFFVIIGLQVKLETFYNGEVIAISCGLLLAAVLGKLVSGLGARKTNDRLLIGIGMLPRGEVGLVFASIGRTLGVITDDLFSAIVLMVMVTTFMAPPLLKARLTK